MNDLCACGHVLDEHEATALAPCAAVGCLCAAFEPNPDGEDDEA